MIAALTVTALVSFALNSLLCRAALGGGSIDAASFTLVRLASGAAVLALLSRGGRAARSEPAPRTRERACSALALFLYALPFSLAYLRISAGAGAFVLFGCVQITMIGSDLLAGRRISGREVVGLAIAVLGLGWLTRPGSESPDAVGVLMMAVAGCAWGIYSIGGRTTRLPLLATARNFAGAVPLSLFASAFTLAGAHIDSRGFVLALLSGGVTSGLGYVAWYKALPSLSATHASILQLAVPPLASALGIGLLGEALTPRLIIAAPLILGGIAIALSARKARP